MCLLAFAYATHPDYPLIVAGNRDEFHSRETQDAQWWPDKPNILGGKDLQAAGSWLALHRSGRFATVTNYRDEQPLGTALKSRGHLVNGFLESTLGPLDYLETIDPADYAGFNLLVSDGKALGYLSNRGGTAQLLKTGVYGLSNAMLDTPWSKVKRSKARLRAVLDNGTINAQHLLDLLADQQTGPKDEVGSGHFPFEKALQLTAPFIVMADYGTRCSSAVLLDSAGCWQFVELRFGADGELTGTTRETFSSTQV